MSAPGGEGIEPGSLVVDEVTGSLGRVRDVYEADGSAYVVFPGGGGRMISPWDMSMAEDQSWEPEGGWDECASPSAGDSARSRRPPQSRAR